MTELQITNSAAPASSGGAHDAAGNAQSGGGFSGLLAGKLEQAEQAGKAERDAQAGAAETSSGTATPVESASTESPPSDPAGAETPGAESAGIEGNAVAAADTAARLLIAMGLAPQEAGPTGPIASDTESGIDDLSAGATTGPHNALAQDDKPGAAKRPNPAWRAADAGPAAVASTATSLGAERAAAAAGAAGALLDPTASANLRVAHLASETALPALQAQPAAQAAFGPASGTQSMPAQSAPVTLAVHNSLGTPAWTEEFSSTVSLLATQRVAAAEIRVQPAELGPVQVSIRIERGETSINFAALHADTRSALEAALPRLRELLEASGIALGNASVGAESFGQSASQGYANTRPRGIDLQPIEAPAPGAIRVPMRSTQLVDTFA